MNICNMYDRNREIDKLIKIFENIIDEKITKLERVSPDIQKEYSEQSSKSNKIIAKDKENSIKNLKKEAKEKFKNAYGTDLKEYMSEEDLDEYITNYYENEVYTTNFGVPLSFVFNNVNYDLLEGKYAYSDSMDEEDDVLPLYKIRLELLQRELGKISYNDIDQEQKESVQEKEKVKAEKQYPHYNIKKDFSYFWRVNFSLCSISIYPINSTTP